MCPVITPSSLTNTLHAPMISAAGDNLSTNSAAMFLHGIVKLPPRILNKRMLSNTAGICSTFTSNAMYA